MEDAMKELVQMAKSLEPGDTKPAEDKMERLRKKVLFWRSGMRKCDVHPAYPDAHKMFNSDDCAGVFGRAPQADAAFRRAVQGNTAGAERRRAMREECRRRYVQARGQLEGE
eukprot:6644522-Prymnesium_polylepis.1